MKLRIYKILKNTKVEGPGNRFCIWVQGCNIHCDGCMNIETWDFNSGKLIDINAIYEEIKKTKGIEGITILGGEPFCQAKALSCLCKMIKENMNLSILSFTGYDYEYILKCNNKEWNEYLKYIDLLIDGPFIREKKDFSRPWIGSSNQKYRFLTKRYYYLKNNLENIKNKVEVRISEEGSIFINGMGDLENIKNSIIEGGNLKK
ncbi:anaerobic ribonucleoside-triphosphate reductase activating protein [Clostridium perfringens]|uniref:anaerobic ribonucleoside-triphosphate reductase activating protein n=1 Tax=Clostridium perfringens TaxID=1502 RepID=UPI001C852E43|nr:anaerobic ribonucleoside-triphosphate reductase activating protein [Clostridium perfringens]